MTIPTDHTLLRPTRKPASLRWLTNHRVQSMRRMPPEGKEH